MRRRELLLGLAAASLWPLAARGQQNAVPVIGFLHSGAPQENKKRLATYFKGLDEEGFAEGRNVAVEYRWAMGQNDRLPALAYQMSNSNHSHVRLSK